MRVANAEMVRALRVMTVERGIDPRALRAAGLRRRRAAARRGDRRGARDDEDPRPARLRRAQRARPGRRRPPRRRPAHRPAATTTRASTRCATRSRAALGGEPEIEVAWDLRYRGQSHELTVRGAERDELRERFEALHEERYGHRDPDGEVELVTVRVTGRLPAPPVDFGAPAGERGRRARRSSRCPRRRSSCPRAGAATTDDTGTLVLERRDERRPDRPAGHRRRAARRVRGDGRRARALGPQRQHQGAPRLLDRALRRRRRDGHAGRAHPRPPRRDARRGRRGARPRPRARASRGSSTTPTRAAPTCPTSPSSRPSSTTASCSASPPPARTTPTSAGACPGSMPADSTTLEEEGVVIAPRVLDDAAIDELAAQMRQPAHRRADLRAQLAANRTGARRLGELADRVGLDFLREATAAVLDYAERRTRACLADLDDGTRTAVDVLEAADGDLELRVAATVDGDELTLDFSRLGRPARGQPQLPAGGDGERVPVRRARAHRPRHPAQRRRLPADHRRRARGLAAQRALAGRGRRRQRRDLLARRRPRARAPSAARSARGR